MEKFLEYLAYAILFLSTGLLILFLVVTATWFLYNHRLGLFMRDNRYGVVVEKVSYPRVKMVRRGFATEMSHTLVLRGVDTGEEYPFNVVRVQYNAAEVADTISFDTLILN